MGDPWDGVVIWDALGNERDREWLAGKYGLVDLAGGSETGEHWAVAALVEEADYPPEAERVGFGGKPALPDAGAAILVACRDELGLPVVGVTVVRYWPGAPELPEALRYWQSRGVYGATNGEGNIGFGMGPGDYYSPPAQYGATWVWVNDPDRESVAVTGLGMLAGTNHDHINVIYTVKGGEPPEPPEDEVLSLLRQILAELTRLRRYWVPDVDRKKAVGEYPELEF